MESMECIAVEWDGMDAFWVILVILGSVAHFWSFLIICWTKKRHFKMSDLRAGFVGSKLFFS